MDADADDSTIRTVDVDVKNYLDVLRMQILTSGT